MNLSDMACVAPETAKDQQKLITMVSGEVAGHAFNDLCKMIGGRFPDCRMQNEAPIAYEFFMRLFGAHRD